MRVENVYKANRALVYLEAQRNDRERLAGQILRIAVTDSRGDMAWHLDPDDPRHTTIMNLLMTDLNDRIAKAEGELAALGVDLSAKKEAA